VTREEDLLESIKTILDENEPLKTYVYSKLNGAIHLYAKYSMEKKSKV
jgi:hypothetical protein